jgi:hypothetical protein
MNKTKFIIKDKNENQPEVKITNKFELHDFVFMIENDSIIKKEIIEILITFDDSGLAVAYRTNDGKMYLENQIFLSVQDISITDLTLTETEKDNNDLMNSRKRKIDEDDTDLPF